jgi:F-type H+-transporting ATPase subunit b
VLIDWFTVVAQIINFLVLVFLLHRFLYGPIVKMMDEREERIFVRLKEAERREAVAEKEEEHYRRERADLAERRRRLLIEAEEEAETQRKELFHQARQEAEAMGRHWQQAIQQEKEQFLRELRRRTTHQVYTVARRALADLADVELERQMVKVFVRRLHDLSEVERTALRPASADPQTGLVVTSAFDLTEEERQSIQQTLHEVVGNSNGDLVAVTFERGDRVINGLELRSASHRVAWNLAHYLQQLEDEINSVIEQETHESERQTELA